MNAVDFSDAAVDARITERRTNRWQLHDGTPRLVQPVPRPVQPLPLDFVALSRERAPERPWFLKDFLGTGPALVAGKGGIGKSTLTTHTAIMGAACRPFFTAAPEKPLRSMVVNCEDGPDDCWRTVERICDHEEIEMASLARDLIVQSRYGHDNALMVEGRNGGVQATPLLEWFREYVNDLRVQVLWLDNAAHLLQANHDDRTVVTAFINALNGLVTGRPFGVVIITHPGRAAGSEYSGSVAWENAVRMRWYLSSTLPDQQPIAGNEPVTNVRYLSKRKSNYSAQDYVRFEMRDGLLVPDTAPAHVGGLVAALDQRKAEEAVLDGFQALLQMGIKPSDGASSPDYLPKHLLSKGLARGFTKRDLDGAMHRLMTAGKFSRGVIGQYSNRNPRFGLVLNEGV